MKAKDMNRIVRIIPYGPYQKEEVKEYLKKQAEISFKAGIREVVEWIDRREKEGYLSHLGREYVWQAKCKEWGYSANSEEQLLDATRIRR